MAAISKNLKLSHLRNRLSYRDEILHSDAQRQCAHYQRLIFFLNLRWQMAAILNKKAKDFWQKVQAAAVYITCTGSNIVTLTILHIFHIKNCDFGF